jgi:uncharacterized protein (TIGR02996 family)
MTVAPPAAVPPLPAPYLHAILAHPGDDGPRLVAADWWDEQGAAERAEFVRVQCELARLPHYGTCLTTCAPPDFEGCPNRAQRRRERELYRGEWDAEAIPAEWVTADESYPAFVYHRGFAEEIACPAADFLAHAGAIRAACPLRRARLTGWADVIEACHVGGEQAMRIKGRSGTTPFYDGPLPSSEEHRRGARFPAREPVLIAGDLFKAEFPGIKFELPLTGSAGLLAPLYESGAEFAPGPPWRVAPHEGTSG